MKLFIVNIGDCMKMNGWLWFYVLCHNAKLYAEFLTNSSSHYCPNKNDNLVNNNLSFYSFFMFGFYFYKIN